MLKNRPLGRTAALLMLIGLACLVAQVHSKRAPIARRKPNPVDAHKKVDDELKDLFRDDEMSSRISTYLDIVPSSHKSRAHASRCGFLSFRGHLALGGEGSYGRKHAFGGLGSGFHALGNRMGKPWFGSRNNGRHGGRKSPGFAQETEREPYKHRAGHTQGGSSSGSFSGSSGGFSASLSGGFSGGSSDGSSDGPSGGSSSDSTNSNNLQTREVNSYDNNLKDVMAIIIALKDSDCEECAPCPTQPGCAPCPEPFCDSCPPCPINSLCTPPEPNQKCPPKPVCEDCDETGTTSTTKAPAKGSTTKKTKTSGRPSTTKAPKESKSSSTTSKPRKGSSTTKKTSKAATSKPSKAKDTPSGSSGDEEMVIGKLKLNKKTKTTNTTTTKTGKDGKVTVVHSTSVTSNITGSWLFDKNVNRLIKNETLRTHFIQMIEEIPEFAGGEEMEMASEILSRLGEKIPKPIKKGNARAFTYATSKNNAKEILGHILDRMARKKCSCPQCPIAPSCKCPKIDCQALKKSMCLPCKQYAPPNCPAPEGCKEYPPCKKCTKNKMDDPDDDGNDPMMLDDEDKIDPLKEDELKRPLKCKGFTCEFEKNCGVADLNPLTPKNSQSGYMVGGVDEVYGEWPHFVRLDITIAEKGFQGLCGGVLISNRHVLTAGHCVVEPYDEQTPMKNISAESFTVILADHDKYKRDEFEQTRAVSSVCHSTKFNDPNFEGSRYDFAVLTLKKNVTFSDHIQPACLPYKPISHKAKCFVVGLGITKYDKYDSKFASRIQKMPVTRASCKNWGFKHTDRSRHCYTKANAPGDACGGDSGGPIVCLSKTKRWTVAGLVSYGSLACDGSESAGWVGVYTRVQALLPQINRDCNI